MLVRERVLVLLVYNVIEKVRSDPVNPWCARVSCGGDWLSLEAGSSKAAIPGNR